MGEPMQEGSSGSALSPCVEYQGYRQGGYGKLTRNGKTWLAHRWVWTQANGDIPEGMCVLHVCDNPPCINLEHLFLGTRQNNMTDMQNKGRGLKHYTHCPAGHEFNEENTYIYPDGVTKACKVCRR